MATIRELTKKDGSKSYHVEVRLKGHPFKRKTFRTKTLAKKWIQDFESAIRDGRYMKTAGADKHTVGEMIERFVSRWLPKFPHRKEKQRSLLEWWKKWCGDMYLSNLTPAVIAQGRDQLLSEETVRKALRSTSTVNRYLSAFGKVLSIAVKEWGWLEDSPMRNVSKPPEAEGRERFLSTDERNRLLEACRASRNPNLLPIVSLALITAMRFGEIAGLKWGDIDFEQGTITLLRTKNGDRRVIPLTEASAAIFRACPTFGDEKEALVFRSHRNTLTPKKVSIREAFENALKRAGIENCRFHDLRHTAASYMAMSGATQGELMAILGHRSPGMTRRYAHYSQKHLRGILDRSAHITI